MNRLSYAITLLGSAALLGSTALAAPPIGVGAGVGAGASGAAHVGVPSVGAPPVGAPRVGVPPVGAPPVSVPQPHASAVPGVNSQASAHARTSTQVTGLPLHGTLTAINGTTVTVRLASGTVETYTVSATTAQQLRTYLNKPIAFTAQNGMLTLPGHEGTPPLHGTLTSVNGTTAVIRLANGTSKSVQITSAQSTSLSARVGKPIVFWTNANGSVQFNQGANGKKRASTAHRKSDEERGEREPSPSPKPIH